MLFHITQVHAPEDCPYGSGGSRKFHDSSVSEVTVHGVYGAFMPLWFQHKGMSASQIGTLVALPVLLRVLFVAPVTALADRLRRVRDVLLVCIAITTALVLVAGGVILGAYAVGRADVVPGRRQNGPEIVVQLVDDANEVTLLLTR